MGKGDFCRIPIDYVLTFDTMPFAVYIKLAEDKIIKLTNEEDQADQVQKYKDKGIEFVFVARADFDRYQKYLKNQNSKKFFEFSSKKPLVAINDRIQESFKEIDDKFERIGVPSAEIRESQKMAIVALDAIQTIPDIMGQLSALSEDSRETFVRSLMTGVASNRIIDTFSWQTTAIKQKMMMAAMLCESVLTPKELDELNAWERGEISTAKLSTSVLNHPKLIVNKLDKGAKKNFPADLLTIIEQHHERPDGTGFPCGYQGQKVVLLACIQIVAKEFVMTLEKGDFAPDAKDAAIVALGKKYYQGNYKSAAVALGQAF